MAAIIRRTNSSLEEQIQTATYEFDFHQAVRLLEKMRPDRDPLGEGSNPLKEALSIQSRVTSSPSGADLQNLHLSSTEAPPVLTINFLGLGGIQGPLPTPYTELLIDRLRHKDTSFKDFLDIFNHRLASFWHRMRKKIVLGIAQVNPTETPIGKTFLDLGGINSSFLRNQLSIPDNALLTQAAIFWKRPRSSIGLQRLLSSYFNHSITVSQFQGAWHMALHKDYTKIGIKGQHQILGTSTILGQRSWNQTTGFMIHIPSLTYHQYAQFQQESSSEFRALSDLTFFYVGIDQQIHLNFSLQKDTIQPTQLNKQFILGRTAWMTRGNGQGFSSNPTIKLPLRKVR